MPFHVYVVRFLTIIKVIEMFREQMLNNTDMTKFKGTMASHIVQKQTRKITRRNKYYVLSVFVFL